MICQICKTKIEIKRDVFYWYLDEYRSDGCVHDDCYLREHEFDGDLESAKKIHEDGKKFYTLPKG